MQLWVIKSRRRGNITDGEKSAQAKNTENHWASQLPPTATGFFSYHRLPPCYAHYIGQPVKNWRILMKQSCAAHMPSTCTSLYLWLKLTMWPKWWWSLIVVLATSTSQHLLTCLNNDVYGYFSENDIIDLVSLSAARCWCVAVPSQWRARTRELQPRRDDAGTRNHS